LTELINVNEIMLPIDGKWKTSKNGSESTNGPGYLLNGDFTNDFYNVISGAQRLKKNEIH